MTEDDLDDLVQKIADAWGDSQTIHTMVAPDPGDDRNELSHRIEAKLQNRFPGSVVIASPYSVAEIKVSKYPPK